MDHAVHYRTSGGETTFEEVGSLEAAVAKVERLRNDEGVSDIRVYKQVPIEFKTYYKVSVVDDAASSGAASAPSAPASTPAPAPAAPSEPAPSTPPPGAMPLGQQTSGPAPSSSEPNGDEESRRGSLFSRG